MVFFSSSQLLDLNLLQQFLANKTNWKDDNCKERVGFGWSTLCNFLYCLCHKTGTAPNLHRAASDQLYLMNHLFMDGPGKTVHFQFCRYISCVLPISNKLPRLEVALQLKHIQYRAKTEGSYLPNI